MKAPLPLREMAALRDVVYGQGYLGTVRHTPNGVTASIQWDLRSTLATRRYMCGLTEPHFSMPALIQDSQSDLAKRWSNWLDDDRLSGHKY